MAEIILPSGGGTVDGTEGDDVFVFDPRNLTSTIVADLGGNDTLRVLNTPDRDAGQFIITATELIFRSLQGGEVRFTLGVDRIGMIETFQWELDPGSPDSRLDQRIVTAPSTLDGYLISYAGTDGNDTVTDMGNGLGLNGWNEIYGNAGHDRLTAASTHQTFLYGGTGNDTLSGSSTGAFGDYLMGDDGNDLLRGLAGDDSLFGGNGADRIEGGRDDDTLSGEAGRDSLFGGSGDDSLSGGSGADSMDGSTGIDMLQGGAGADHLRGGRGEDHFIYSFVTDSLAGKANRDQILDFDQFTERIDLRAIDANLAIDGDQAFRMDKGGRLTAGEIKRTTIDGGVLLQLETGALKGVDMEIFVKDVSSLSSVAFLL